ncbi:MAG: glycosyltransferase [bacterium]|nr:glycosyltransferase [bacterium]
MLRAREIIRTSHADVVLTNFNKESWQFGVAGRSLKIPVVARHGFTLWSKKLRHKLLAQKVITKLIVNAASIRDSYQELGCAPKDITIIPNGVNTVVQRSGKLRRQLGITESDLLIVAAGRLESQKRFDRVLNCAAQLKQSHSFKLAIFGVGPDENALREQVKQLDLGQHVAFCGFDPELSSLISDADLFLLTSDEEGTPNVVLEAMIAGVPVLGFNVGSMNTILNGELSEFLIEAGNDAAFQTKFHLPDYTPRNFANVARQIPRPCTSRFQF